VIDQKQGLHHPKSCFRTRSSLSEPVESAQEVEMSEANQKWMESVDQRLSYMAGQMLALNIAIGCLLKTHPNPATATKAMQQECEDAMSHLLPSTLDDAFLEGMALVKNRFLYGTPEE